VSVGEEVGEGEGCGERPSSRSADSEGVSGICKEAGRSLDLCRLGRGVSCAPGADPVCWVGPIPPAVCVWQELLGGWALEERAASPTRSSGRRPPETSRGGGEERGASVLCVALPSCFTTAFNCCFCCCSCCCCLFLLKARTPAPKATYSVRESKN